MKTIFRELEKPFVIYKSSAGSGKTYTLAKEYVTLALREPDYFRRILAVTFTNKAAEEMKSRILLFLEGLSRGNHELAATLAEYYQQNAEWVAKRAELVLSNILHNYAKFSIFTIDTFFHKVIRNFAREIGLQGGFQIEMDSDYVLDEAIEMMLADLTPNTPLAKWLTQFARVRLQEGQSYEFKREIVKLGKLLFSENFKALELNLGSEVTLEQLLALQKEVNSILAKYDATLVAKAQEATSIIAANGLGIEDFAGGNRGGMGKKFIEISVGAKFEISTTMLKAYESSENWYTKKYPKKEFIHGIIENQLRPILCQIIDFHNENFQKYATAKAIKQYLFTLGILQELSSKINTWKDENDSILISDLPDFLRQIIRDADAPFIYEKFGNRYAHFLIDEFQDTSEFQWGNFKPLIENSLASGQFNMLVGDAKQSIYRWRGGDWQLLLQGVENQLGDAAVQSKKLTTNYRSAQKVIEFNNSLYELAPVEIFQHLATSIEQELPSDLQESILEKFAMVNLAYKDASQQWPEGRVTDDGFISIKFEEKGKGEESFKETGLAYAIECAEQLQAKGYPLSDIAFLVRTNEEAKLLVQGFLQKSNAGESEYRYDVISADAMYLKNSPVVNFILAVFKYMYDEKDAISLAQVVHDYHTYIKKSVDQNPHSLFGSFDKAMNLPEAFIKHILILKRLPLYELVESLIRIFDLTEDHSEWIFIQAFQDAILDFTKNDSGDLISFMAWWEIKGVKRTVQINASGNAMSIITIHKAKGLEFPAVILPFCNWSFDNTIGHDTIIWVEGGDASMTHKPRLMPLQYKKELRESAYLRQYFEEKSKAFIENLNVLYVATTRAEKALMIRCEQPAKNGNTLNTGVVLHSFLLKSELPWHKSVDGWTFELGKIDPYVAKEKVKSELALSSYPSTQWRSKIAIKKSGKQYFDEVRTQSVNIGIIVHDLIAQLQDYTQIDSVLQRAYDQMTLNSEDFNAIKKLIHQVMENEEIKKWFEKGLMVKTEPTVLLPTGRQLRMDRVIFEGKKATVIDFKTGLPKDADRKQVREYVSVLVYLGYANCEGYLVYLADNNIEKIA